MRGEYHATEERGEEFVLFFILWYVVGISGALGGCYREHYLEDNIQLEKVGGDPEARKRCDRRGNNKMVPRTTTTMEHKSTSTYQAVEEEQEQHNSAAEDDDGCQERTVVLEDQGLCGSGRALLDAPTEKQ